MQFQQAYGRPNTVAQDKEFNTPMFMAEESNERIDNNTYRKDTNRNTAERRWKIFNGKIHEAKTYNTA